MKNKFLLILVMASTTAFSFERGGDDAGNGGFAYKQSIKILEMATANLEHKILDSNLPDFNNHPERKLILNYTLNYDHLQKLPKKNAYRGGKKLAMDYVVNPPTVKILKPYYETFMGKTDGELEEAALEVEKRLLHEAAHIWGYNEKDSEDFALRLLAESIPPETRPTNDIDIKPDFCSCLNGKSDIINSCDDFCRTKPVSTSPILYLNTIMGAETSANPKLGNLYNWCTVQLDGDTTSPQCFLEAYDGTNTITNIPVAITKGSNSLIADIKDLSLDRTYIMKIVEAKTGSDAQSKEFQLRRKTQKADPDPFGALSISPANQYTCLLYGGTLLSNGSMERTTYTRSYYYFSANEIPAPIPSPGGTNESFVVCHDDQLHPGNDSIEYPRLELIPSRFLLWNKADPRFVSSDGSKMNINRILETRLYNEYGISANLNLFNMIFYPNRPSNSTSNVGIGYLMAPFTDHFGLTFCPTSSDYNGTDPLFNLLKDYMDDTQGLFVAEGEGETIQDGTSYKTIYATQFVTESNLKKYSFYIEGGVKIKADSASFNTKTIFYYWPFNDTIDPLLKGDRKLFTVKTPETLNGTAPTGYPTTVRTSDKRIGCVPKN